MKFPEITTSSLRLKEIQYSNRTDLLNIFSDVEVVKYYDLEPFTNESQSDKLISLFQSRFSDGLGIRWGIFLNNSATCIGTCGFNSWNGPMRSTTIGYDLRRDFWGRGITTEALRGIIHCVFSGKLACPIINRIQADTIPGNIASEKVLLKLGFIEEGIRRQSGYWKDQYHDLKCFGLLKNNFHI